MSSSNTNKIDASAAATAAAAAAIESLYSNICRELNMDKETENNSWKSYVNVSKTYPLEGDPRHWFCCSLYTGCRESIIPTVGSSTSVVKGNCVSLTKLLRSCHISIYDFFLKIKKWIDITSCPQHFLNQVERLERSFGVSFVLYQKYCETFEQLFITSTAEKRSTKKSKPGKCPANKLYDFCWCLFLCIKGEDPKHTVDIVTSFHLLLCCIDLIFLNASTEERDDIINSNFTGNSSKISNSQATTTCILSSLCKMHDVQYMDAKDMKLYSFKKILNDFIKAGTLHGDSDTLMGIISNKNFEYNLKSLNNTYEQYVLSVGDFDERIFLSNVNMKKNCDADSEKLKQSQISTSIKSLVPGTPFTRRHLLPNNDCREPISSATQNVKRLQYIAEKTTEPDFIKNPIEQNSPAINLKEIITKMFRTFCQTYPTRSEAEKRCQLARSLYYYLLEKIVRGEIKSKPQLDFKVFLEFSEVFHVCLIACCLEIVLVAYNSKFKFPWILECFNLEAFNFYKVIEVVVLRHDDALTRSIIIHLNKIEEQCLDSLVWQSKSKLWTIIKQWGSETFPSWMSVDKSKTMNRTDSTNFEKYLLLSPVNSAYDSYRQITSNNNNNNNNNNNESARRDLFNAGKAAAAVVVATAAAAAAPGTNNIKCNNQENNGNRKGTGSLLLFCRKFYKLAYMRISELCKELDLQDNENLSQIWTLFEHSIMYTVDLMQDRHLDQIIMCAIYVFIKVKDIKDKTFTDIMKFYRNQPQAASHIYREVLIKPATSGETGAAAGTTTITPGTYNDIIHFYNNVYVQKMTPYALEFGDKSKSAKNLLLSPHPPENITSPKRLLINHHLYILPLEKSYSQESPNSITYEFCKSPAKDLEKINQLVRGGRRNLPFQDDGIDGNNGMVPTKKPFIPKKMQELILEKRDANK